MEEHGTERSGRAVAEAGHTRDQQAVKLKSWNRFVTRGLHVCPQLMGKTHNFQHDGAEIEVRIPSLDLVDRGPTFDEVATAGSRWAKDNLPIEYQIVQVDVIVNRGLEAKLDPKILTVPPKAYQLVPEDQQTILDDAAKEHGALASHAFQYWLSILRWAVGDYRLGQAEVSGHASGWTTYLHDALSESRVWIESVQVRLAGRHVITAAEWEDAQEKLDQRTFVPIHLALKFEAEEFLARGDTRRSLIDICVSCETFLRQTVMRTLPSTLEMKVRGHVEDANITQYVNHFFPALLKGAAVAQYKKLPSELTSLFAKRNAIMHRGDVTGATRENCIRFLGVARTLFSISV